MNITSYARKEIEEEIKKARETHHSASGEIRLLLAPEVINEDNIEQACNLYSRVDMSDYETVVVVESHDQILEKKVLMASNGVFETPLGGVPANGRMSRELRDESNDFYTRDEVSGSEISLFQQLMFLQVLSDDFSIVSIQIANDNPETVRELAAVIEEVLASVSVLLVFCCELDSEFSEE
ncbi:MAG TPA: AmmeMemoRadiSam system protein B, partial [Fodinibius sp.]|nr:AmmeMemoRadiSam system protein B [Fodinibius sp.]